MDEYSISSYAWLADQLDIPIIGPETALGRHQTRAEWIAVGIRVVDVHTVVTGIAGCLRAVHIAGRAHGLAQMSIGLVALGNPDRIGYDARSGPFVHVNAPLAGLAVVEIGAPMMTSL